MTFKRIEGTYVICNSCGHMIPANVQLRSGSRLWDILVQNGQTLHRCPDCADKIGHL